MKFKKWLDAQLKNGLPEEVVAINFNLYEGEKDGHYDAQIVGCPSYDPDDSDWACDELFSSEEDLYHFKSGEWEVALEDFQKTLEEYLESTPESILHKYDHITIGFVDGDLVTVVDR